MSNQIDPLSLLEGMGTAIALSEKEGEFIPADLILDPSNKGSDCNIQTSISTKDIVEGLRLSSESLSKPQSGKIISSPNVSDVMRALAEVSMGQLTLHRSTRDVWTPRVPTRSTSTKKSKSKRRKAVLKKHKR